MPDVLHALSIIQPWLWAIVEGYKPVENREWKPWRYVVGRRIALHASRGWDHEGAQFINRQLQLAGVQRQVGSGVPRGAILGTAVVVGAFKPDGSRAEVAGAIMDAEVDRLAASPWSFGPWIWKLAEVRPLAEPVACKGSLGLWRVPEDIAARVRELEGSPVA